MNRLLHTLWRYRALELLLFALWAGFWAAIAITGRLGADWDVALLLLLPALPLVTSALIAWWLWRPASDDRRVGAALPGCGAALAAGTAIIALHAAFFIAGAWQLRAVTSFTIAVGNLILLFVIPGFILLVGGYFCGFLARTWWEQRRARGARGTGSFGMRRKEGVA